MHQWSFTTSLDSVLIVIIKSPAECTFHQETISHTSVSKSFEVYQFYIYKKVFFFHINQFFEEFFMIPSKVIIIAFIRRDIASCPVKVVKLVDFAESEESDIIYS